jgi:hypothetical protein
MPAPARPAPIPLRCAVTARVLGNVTPGEGEALAAAGLAHFHRSPVNPVVTITEAYRVAADALNAEGNAAPLDALIRASLRAMLYVPPPEATPAASAPAAPRATLPPSETLFPAGPREAAPAPAAALTPAEFEVKLAQFVAAVQAMQDDHFRTNHPILAPPRIETMAGGKYVRIVRQDREWVNRDERRHGDASAMRNGSQRSVYCFVEKSTGRIFKAESWKKPAAHPRGSILNENPLDGCTVYGAAYLR